MTNTGLKIITTEDGSHSLLREDLNETYHSFHGARGESLHVFIQHGVRYVLENFPEKRNIRVFEVGFGTGLNAFLVARLAQESNILIDFHTVEPIPVPEDIFMKFNFGATDEEKHMLQQIHRAEWEQPIQLNKNFQITKYKATLEGFNIEKKPADGFDVVFFDAFAPSKQAEIWSLENLKKCCDLLRGGGILTTYCAQGQFKRNLATVGFEVQTLKGALGKKEMVRGVKFQ